jgi:hypothetical protein
MSHDGQQLPPNVQVKSAGIEIMQAGTNKFPVFSLFTRAFDRREVCT